ncbi:MAG: BatD family protein [bacterium]
MIVSSSGKIYISEKSGKFIILLLALYLLISVNVSGQERISLSSSVDKSRIKIGDIINYKVKVVHDKNITLKMPGMGANLGGFEIRDYEEFKPRKEDDMIVSQAEYSISTFTTGKFVIPPLEVQYKETSDTAYKKLATRKIEITVESMKPSEEGDIKDIKAPVELPFLWWEVWGKWTALGLGILAVATAAFFVYRRKKMGKSIFPKKEPPPRPPHEVAFESLDRIKASKLLENGDIKLYYVKISETVRVYFEGRYYIPALERTTPEIMEELNKIRIDAEVYELIKNLFITSDMVKFAKVIPEPDTNVQILQTAYTIVDRTKVLPIEEQQEKSGESDNVFPDSSETEEGSEEKNHKESTEEMQENREEVNTQGEK